jgi:hypothetical protein
MLLLVVNFFLDRLYKELAFFNKLNNTVDNQYAEYNDTLKYLSFGNSHDCINAYILDKSFNYGSPSENYVQTYYKFRSVLQKYSKRPEQVILFIDISDFGPKISNRFDYTSYWVKYVDFAELARLKHDKDLRINWFAGKFCSYAGNYKEMQLTLLYLIKIGHLDLYRGYHPPRDFRNFAREKDRRKLARKKAELYFTKDDYFDEDMAFYFERLLRLCQDHHINVILIRMPVTKEFFEEASRIVPIDKLYEKADKVISKYPNVIHVLDYHDRYFDHPEYFFDPDHLNPVGSDSLTVQLKKDLSVSPEKEMSY